MLGLPREHLEGGGLWSPRKGRGFQLQEPQVGSGCAAIDVRLRRIVHPKTACREHAAVIGPTRLRSVLVDRTHAVDQHRAMTVLVVTHHDVATSHKRRGKQQRSRNVTQRFGLIRSDVDELRGRAAGRAFTARNFGIRCASEGGRKVLQPYGEVSGGQVRLDSVGSCHCERKTDHGAGH